MTNVLGRPIFPSIAGAQNLVASILFGDEMTNGRCGPMPWKRATLNKESVCASTTRQEDSG